MTKVIRMSEQRKLNQILPTGREGGLEFARIIDLLLFRNARNNGKSITIFSDRAGDYRGLDSFGNGGLRTEEKVGYQYKFFPSPLNDQHRSEVEKALMKAQTANRKLKSKDKLNKWILVTPDDLIESGRKAGGGDVTWFYQLRAKYALEFEIEHWGHTKLQALFIEAPSICLFYYPDLVDNGSHRRKSIEETALVYRENLKSLYGRIEFVGMSVYKADSTRGVLMEHIYIPLSTVAEIADDRDQNVLRKSPFDLVIPPGGRHVILGDPGSGKSTLLKFLALSGNSRSLQERYKVKPDSRLPILVVLRKYADALKDKQDLSLFDYLINNIQADLSLNHADKHFFEYFLDSGQAILLFDGMDELPNPKFKETVRNRIHNFLNTYPGNTALITSRIVGYENPFRFEDSQYDHHKVARLAKNEIEIFISDWYQARVENIVERDANIDDLKRILSDPQAQAIRELASNPLLLTIIALVHRIDAVLPDERVVLYQKCTETLLNTWHTWKSMGTDVNDKKIKTEQRNRRRIEALAYWMHEQAGSNKSKERAVISFDNAIKMLKKHISEEENVDKDEIEDEAVNFLLFVKSRAGLLIEVGDSQYSFVHLTFQEYLASTKLASLMELHGASSMWQDICVRSLDPRWNEVIRLLIAGFKSVQSSIFMIKELISYSEKNYDPHQRLLLGGLLLDGIEAAEFHANQITKLLFDACLRETDQELVHRLISTIKALPEKYKLKNDFISDGFKLSWKDKSASEKRDLIVIWLAAELGLDRLRECTKLNLSKTEFNFINLLLNNESDIALSPVQERKMVSLANVIAELATISPWTNLVASVLETIFPSNLSPKLSFQIRLFLFQYIGYGPFEEFEIFPSLLAQNKLFKRSSLRKNEDNHVVSNLMDSITWALSNNKRPRSKSLTDKDDSVLARLRAGSYDRLKSKQSQKLAKLLRTFSKSNSHLREDDLLLNLKSLDHKYDSNQIFQSILSSNILLNQLSELVVNTLDLGPIQIWSEALKRCFAPNIQNRSWIYKQETFDELIIKFRNRTTTSNDEYIAATLLLHALWMHAKLPHQKDDYICPYQELADLTKHLESPPLQAAHLMLGLSKGDKSDIERLRFIKNPEFELSTIFRDAYWLN